MRSDSKQYVHIPLSAPEDISGLAIEVGYAPNAEAIPDTWFPTINEPGGVRWLVDPEGDTSLVAWKGKTVHLIVRIPSAPERPVLFAGSIYVR